MVSRWECWNPAGESQTEQHNLPLLRELRKKIATLVDAQEVNFLKKRKLPRLAGSSVGDWSWEGRSGMWEMQRNIFGTHSFMSFVVSLSLSVELYTWKCFIGRILLFFNIILLQQEKRDVTRLKRDKNYCLKKVVFFLSFLYLFHLMQYIYRDNLSILSWLFTQIQSIY